MSRAERLLSLLPPSVKVTYVGEVPLLAPCSSDAVKALLDGAGTSQCLLSFRPWETGEARVSYDHLNEPAVLRAEEGLVRVSPGMHLGAFSDFLAENYLRLPVVLSDHHTAGDLLAYTPLSLCEGRYGMLRHWLTGVEAVTGDAQAIHYGGDVVKNVTGYDMAKLFCGARHQLGVVTRMTLRLEPLLDATSRMLLHVDTSDQAFTLIDQLQTACLTWDWAAVFSLKTTFGWQILAQLAGPSEALQADLSRVSSCLTGLNPALQTLDMSAATAALWAERLDWAYPECSEAWVMDVYLHTHFQPRLLHWLGEEHALHQTEVVIPAGASRLALRWAQTHPPDPKAIQRLRSWLAEHGGEAHMTRWPVGADVAPYKLRPDTVQAEWFARLKAAYDPRGILPSVFTEARVK